MPDHPPAGSLRKPIDSQASLIICCQMSLGRLVETGGIEPPTSCLQSRRSPD